MVKPDAAAGGAEAGATLDDRYILAQELGTGGMGRVFTARDVKLGRDVAIKVLRAGPHDEAQLARLVQEARTTGSLAHPNIVAIHDVGTFAGGPYFVQELLRGETLRERLRRGPLSPERALDLAVQLARGLAAAHEQGIVHRDIKPDNLFVTADGALKILDFGIAILQPASQGPQTWSSELNKSIAGTPAYMSPEQIHGQATDVRSDLFSFGAVLYEMLAGSPAFARKTAIETAFAVVRDPVAPLPPAVPPSLVQITLRCLEKDPAARFSSAREVTLALESLQGHLRPGQLRRRIVLMTMAGLLVTLAAAALVRSRRPPPPQFRQLTFLRGMVWSARFAPGGKSVYYTATEDVSAPQIYAATMTRPEPQRLATSPASLLAVSSTGELALLLRPQLNHYQYDIGVLARWRPGPAAPREILENVEFADWSPDGSTLAVVRSAEGRTRLEYPIGHVLYQTAGWISDPRFSPDGRQIAFLHHASPVEAVGAVMVVDIAGSVRTMTPDWRYALGLAWAKSGREIWFTAAPADDPGANYSLRAVDVGSGKGRVIAQIGGNLQIQDVAPDGTALLTEPLRRLGLAIQKAGESKTRDASWFDQTFLGDISADGRKVLFTVEGPATGNVSVVYLRDTDASAPVRLGEGYGVALSPDGRWAISLSLTKGPLQPMTFLPTGPGEPKTLDAGGVTATRVRWFADGKRLLIAGLDPKHGTSLYVRSAEGGAPRAISRAGLAIAAMAISPDGQFAAAGDEQGRTTLFPVDGGDPVPVPEVEPDELPLGFAADGSLFVARRRSVTVPVFRVDHRTKSRGRVATLVADAPGAFGISRIGVTPDGSTFAFNYVNVSSNLYALEDAQ